MNKLYKINKLDNVAVAVEDISKGYCENGITALDNIPFGHKIALCDMKAGENIIKYGNPIGHLVCDVSKGGYVHEHNLKTNLSDTITYSFDGDNSFETKNSPLTFDGYLRNDGSVGTRNEIWIIPTVGCVNETARAIERTAQSEIDRNIFAFTHPYGCSQMGEDQEDTRKALSALIKHPNAGGVLVLSLGCENTNIGELKKYIGDYDENRVKFLVVQDVENEYDEALALLKELYSYTSSQKRTSVPVSKLKIGFKCGGSDAFSGITANALCGEITDTLTKVGASCILTEVPEMFGAEHLLMMRVQNKKVFDDLVKMINSYKDYFSAHNQVCYENPSPGNHAGGITTLEEKSLGCIQKGGSAVITDVIDMYQPCKKSGLTLLYGPGNDIVSTTNLTCAGANIIVFTTGRGTPLGAPVPTIKLASNSVISKSKANWIDMDSSQNDADSLLKLIIDVASGKNTKNEINSCRQIAIFKSGVIL